jgi:membrane-bound metal-dependent hydrolase YbcI (DUF457 family)
MSVNGSGEITSALFAVILLALSLPVILSFSTFRGCVPFLTRKEKFWSKQAPIYFFRDLRNERIRLFPVVSIVNSWSHELQYARIE